MTERTSDAKRQDIIDLVATGIGAVQACGQVGVGIRTFRQWCKDDADYAQAYQEARQAGADCLADEIQAIGRKALESPELANGARVAIDAFKWVAAKIKPRTYGDRTEIVNTDEKALTATEILARIAELQAELGHTRTAGEVDAMGESTSTPSAHTSTATPAYPVDPAPVSPAVRPPGLH